MQEFNQEFNTKMQKTVEVVVSDFASVRAGRANAAVLDKITVDYYGTMTPIQQVASISTPDPRSLMIQPWDKNMLRPIEKAIIDSNIGLTPSNNGEQIRLSIPPLTEERRKDLVKQVRGEGETGRISLRNARRDALEAFKKAQKEGMPEDEAKDGETRIQKVLEKYTKLLDAALDRKEKEIMTV